MPMLGSTKTTTSQCYHRLLPLAHAHTHHTCTASQEAATHHFFHHRGQAFVLTLARRAWATGINGGWGGVGKERNDIDMTTNKRDGMRITKAGANRWNQGQAGVDRYRWKGGGL